MKSPLLISKLIFMGLATLVLVAVVTPKLRTSIQKKVTQDHRRILSAVSGDVLGDGTSSKILKVKTHEGIFIEIYTTSENQHKLLQKIQLEDKKDGYFMFNGEASNLVLDDIDGDHVAEILVPSFDKDLIARLNIFSFSKNHNSFVRLN